MNIYDLTYDQLLHALQMRGEKASKAPFIYRGLYQAQITSLLDIPAIRLSLREQLAADFTLAQPQLLAQTEGQDTSKFLFSLTDGSLIEAVLMRQAYGHSLCISSQVGCNMACAFCQSGRFKKVRNLTAGEMVAQILAVQRLSGLKISNIVLMGIGEPFDNYDNVIRLLDIITHPHGLAIGRRHITVSTCGIVPRITQYAEEANHGLLAISLHAPDDATRSQLMPINRRYPLEELLAAARAYIHLTNRKVMLEYVMLQDVNDSPAQARQLAAHIGQDAFHVNLIPYNDTQSLGFQQSSPARIRAFYETLRQQGVFATMRREFGASVNAACGQLRADYQRKQGPLND